MSCIMNDTATRFESLGQWHDFWAVVLFSAPDGFREYDERSAEMATAPDQAAALEAAYETLISGFHFAHRKLKDEQLIRIIRELIEMAFEAYRAGDRKRGNHTLQEAEGMIWRGRQLPVKYAVEAERRIFGAVIRYKDVRVSPYPFEGTRNDLGPAQEALLQTAERFCQGYLDANKEFKYFGWVHYPDGTIEQIKAPSRKKLQQHFRELAETRQIDGAALAELMISAVSGLIVFHLHEQARPHVRAIAKTNHWRYEPLRFHFEDPSIFLGVDARRATPSST
jgi:hypothetical protein